MCLLLELDALFDVFWPLVPSVFFRCNFFLHTLLPRFFKWLIHRNWEVWGVVFISLLLSCRGGYPRERWSTSWGNNTWGDICPKKLFWGLVGSFKRQTGTNESTKSRLLRPSQGTSWTCELKVGLFLESARINMYRKLPVLPNKS